MYSAQIDEERIKDYAEPFMWLLTTFAQRRKVNPALLNEIRMTHIEKQCRPDGELYHDAKQNFYSLASASK